MDPRVERAQQLFWEIAMLKRERAFRPCIEKLVEMATLHEDRAFELLQCLASDGWTELYAAITAWGEAGSRHEAERLIEFGRSRAGLLLAGEGAVHDQLAELESWLDGIRVLPSLRDFDRPLPKMGMMAGAA